MPTPSKKTLRLCHLADVHLGYRRFSRLSDSGHNQREIDVSIAFREAVDRIIKIKPDLVLIAGDLFHSVRPSNTMVTFGFKQIRRLVKSSKAPVVIVAGNHESPKRVDTGCVLSILAEIEGVFVSDRTLDQFIFPDMSLSVTCLPHLALKKIDEFVLKADDRFKYNVLLSHLQIGESWLSDFGGVELALSRLAPHEWDYIALGHVHCYQELALNAAYSGSTEHTSANLWSESDVNKGFLEVEASEWKADFS